MKTSVSVLPTFPVPWIAPLVNFAVTCASKAYETVLFPSPPKKLSLPAPPRSKSSPSPPFIVFAFASPISVSLFLEPVILSKFFNVSFPPVVEVPLEAAITFGVASKFISALIAEPKFTITEEFVFS